MAETGVRDWVGYALTTLLLTGAGVALAGGGVEIAGGALSAWAVQVVSFRPLVAALREGRPAMRIWIVGLLARAAGLVAAATLTFVAGAAADLPLAYGLAMTGLLLCEAGWLAARLGRPGSFERPAGGSEPPDGHLNRTRSSG